MSFSSSTYLSLSALALFSFASCSSSTVGDQLSAQGEGPAAALGKEWNRSEKMIKDGKKKIRKGENLVDDGKAEVKKGERLKAETELAATRAGYLNSNQ